MTEQEVKLPFDDAEAARRAVTTAGGRLGVSRRLLDDTLYDTSQARLRASGCALRVRRDGGAGGILTYKGPVQPGPVKAREEIETTVGDAAVAERLLTSLGFQPWFRAQKYREEYALDGTEVAVDETPMGVFVEIEGEPAAIARVAARLGRGPADYRLESYVELHARWCRARGLEPGDMVF
jgi:adenylate cyclase, class 2